MHQRIEVVWIDAVKSNGEQPLEVILDRELGVEVRTTGYLVSESEDFVIVAMGYQPQHGNFMDTLEIPREVVTRITYLPAS